MHIGLVVYGSLSQRSGGYLYDRMLVAELRRHKHQVEVISLPWRSYLAHLGDNFSADLVRRIQRKKLDLLLQDELNHPSLFLLNARLKREVNIPIVSIVHHLRSSEPRTALLNGAYRAIERAYLRSVDGFVFNSQTTRKVVRGLLGRLPRHVVARPAGDRLRPTPRAVGEAALRARSADPGPLRVVFLGSLIRRKAPHLLLEAVRRLPSGTVKVTFAGGSSADPGYARHLQAAGRGLAGVRFGGHLGEAQLARLLASSQVLALPSAYEGYGIAYLEGMGFGLPAIGTRAGAAGELIRQGKNGFLIRPGDTAELARLLARLQAQRGLLLRLSLEAQRCHRQHSGWAESMARAADFLSSFSS